MRRRFGDGASIDYVDASDPSKRDAYARVTEQIDERSLLYPVTVIDGVIEYDGAVSYPAILRAVEAKLGTAA
jgi:disulfide oxidoreductase YuzD